MNLFDGIRVSEKNVLITSSGQQGLDLTGRLLLDPGDALLVDRPTFAGALVAFQMQRPLFSGIDIESDGQYAQYPKIQSGYLYGLSERDELAGIHRQMPGILPRKTFGLSDSHGQILSESARCGLDPARRRAVFMGDTTRRNRHHDAFLRSSKA